MNIINKGTLAVVVATATASAMILLAGNSVADNKDQSVSKVSDSLSGTMPTTGAKTNALVDGILDKRDRKTGVVSTGRVKKPVLAPPPGPYLSQESLMAPVAPIAPVPIIKVLPVLENLSTTMTAPAKPKILESATKADKPIISSAPLAPSQSMTMKQVAPKFNNKLPSRIGAVPVAPESPNNIPIWMQGATVKGSKQSAQGTQQQKGLQAQNMGWNYPSQQYMYVPVPMMPLNFNAPQMPRFNSNLPMQNYGFQMQNSKPMIPQQRQALPNPNIGSTPEQKDLIK